MEDDRLVTEGGKRFLSVSIVLVFAGLLGGMVLAANNEHVALPPSLDMEVDGEQRFFDVRLPPGHSAAVPAPLLLVLHGGSGSASRMEFLSRWTETACAAGYIVVYPEGLDGDWNDGRRVRTTRAAREQINDVGFLDDLVLKMADHYSVDLANVFITGYDSGGMMALRYACAHAERVRAVAVVDALLPQETMEWCQARGTVPAMFVVQKDSPVAPYLGGELKLVNLKRGWVLGAKASAAHWAEVNGFEGRPVETPGEGAIIETGIYGEGQAQVKLLTIEGSSFDIPGGRPMWTMRAVNGPPVAFNSAAAMLEFFEEHRQTSAADGAEIGES